MITARPPVARTILRLHAVVSTASGAILFLGAIPLARALGIGHTGWVAGTGILFFLYGIHAMLVSVRRGIGPQHILPFVVGDLLWVAAALGVLVFAPHEIGTAGRALLAVLAAEGASFAAAQLRATRALA